MRFRFPVVFAVCLGGLLSGCYTEGPEPTSGAISGSVTPAGGAREVFLASGSDTIRMSVKTDGTFEKSEIVPKRYQLGVKSNLGFEGAAPYAVLITPGKTMQATPFRLKRLPAYGAFSLTLNKATITDSIDIVSTTNSEIQTTFGSDAKGYTTLTITFPTITKPDTFHTSTHPDLKVTVLYDKKTWVADNTQGEAALRVTAFDPVTKKGNATFSFEAVLPGDTSFIGENGNLRFVRLKN